MLQSEDGDEYEYTDELDAAIVRMGAYIRNNRQTCDECHGDGMCSGCSGNGRMLLQTGYLAACLDCPGNGACQECNGRGWTLDA
jgi:hypothetical protein